MTHTTFQPAPAARALARILLLCAVAALAIAGSGCTRAERSAMRGCVVVDVSGSSRPEITRMYLPGFQRFVERMASEGSGNVCFALTAKGMIGGPGTWAKFGCKNPDDTLRCDPEIRAKATAAAKQLAATGKGDGGIGGASKLVEGLSRVAPAMRQGDQILLLSDALQSSPLTGNFYRADLSDAGIDAILDKVDAKGLLPDLDGRVLRIPYAVSHSGGKIGLEVDEQQRIEEFWRRYAERTGAELHMGGGHEDA